MASEAAPATIAASAQEKDIHTATEIMRAIHFGASAGWESSARNRISPNAIATALKQLAIALSATQLSAMCGNFWPVRPYLDAPDATITALTTIRETSVSSESVISAAARLRIFVSTT